MVGAGCKVGVIYSQRRSIKDWYNGPHGIVRQKDNEITTLRLNGIKWMSLFSNGNTHLWLRDGIKLYERYVRSEGVPDIIHAQSNIYGGILAYRINKKFGVPYVITEHSTGYARDRISYRQRQLAADAVKNASRRFAVSEPFCDFLQNYFGLQNGSWEPLPNIVNRSFTEYPLSDSASNTGKFVFVSIALLTPKKGIRDLVNAFSRAFSHDKKVHLVIGGDGVERQQLEELVRKLGLSTQVVFLGALSREQVLEQVEAADAFVSSSHYETFGVVVAEALALGKPVIATRCGGPESIVRNRDGILVAPANVEELAEAMKSMRENIEKYDSQEIRQACISRFGEATVTAILIENYKDAIDSVKSDVVRSP